MYDSLNRACGIGLRPSRMWSSEAWESAASSLWVEWVAKIVGPCVVLGVAEHRVAVPVDRIESGVGVPGLVEVDPVHARVEQLLHPPGVVAEAVVGRVGDDRVHRPGVDPLGHQRVGLDGRLERGRLEAFRRDRADDAVAVPERHQVRAGSPPDITRLCSIDLWQFRSQSAIWSRPTAAMKMTRLDMDVPLVTL